MKRKPKCHVHITSSVFQSLHDCLSVTVSSSGIQEINAHSLMHLIFINMPALPLQPSAQIHLSLRLRISYAQFNFAYQMMVGQ